jgi:heptosyltransferase-3
MNKILIIIRRSNGDVFLSEPLIRVLKQKYNAQIDILINADTLAIAKTIPYINNIYIFNYQWRGLKKIINTTKLFWKIFKKYDLAINLTTNDRSTKYAIFSAKKSISVIDKEKKKNWWKKLLLNNYYYLENKHIVLQNLTPLQFLNINLENKDVKAYYKEEVFKNLQNKYGFLKEKYIIFHPSAQYNYKIYPKELRNILLNKLNSLNIPIVITGSSNSLDMQISKTIPHLKNIYNLIGKTSLEEYIALSDNSLAYIGMDTLNMHIAAAQKKSIFAIFGPTLHYIWSPWSNISFTYAKQNTLPVTKYDNITIFQANMECVACGKAGCDDRHGRSDCLYNISPQLIFNEVKKSLC